MKKKRGQRRLDLTRLVLKKLAPLDKLNLHEQYAIFMGKAQIVEFRLKNILVNKYGYSKKRTERLTLGQAIHELERKKIEPNFIEILKELNKHRVYIAHELLADDVIMTSLVGKHRFSSKRLDQGLFSLELAIQVHDLLVGSGNL